MQVCERDRTIAPRGRARHLLMFIASLVVAASDLNGAEDTTRLAQAVTIRFGGQEISLAKGTAVQILREDSQMATVSLQLPDGSPLITQMALRSIVSAPSTLAPVMSVVTKSAVSNSPPDQVQRSSIQEHVPSNNAPSEKPNPQPGLNTEDTALKPLPNFSATLKDLDIALPPKRYTALRGYFYILINGVAVPVVYSLPMKENHLAKSASNLIFYGPYPNEQTTLTGNIVPKIVENLGYSVFSLSFKQAGADLANPKTAYWSKESPWFPAVLTARDEIIKGFGLQRKKLILMGYSCGGGMVLEFAGAFPTEIEAVAAQGANHAPDSNDKNGIKWLIVNNRGEPNIPTTLSFYNKLQSLGCEALYCETTPERGRGNYHSPSGQAYDLMYSFLDGILTQRTLEENGPTDLAHLWPYLSPKDPLKRYAIIKTLDVDENTISGGAYDLLPSAAFALDWSKVCAPAQTMAPNKNELASLHVSFPACSKPLATVLYYASPDYRTIARVVEDINDLAEHGYIVISPVGATKPQDFANSATSWIDSQGTYAGTRIHLVGYGRSGAQFISTMAKDSGLNFSVQSMSLVDFENSVVDAEVKVDIETLARSCGMYGFFSCSDSVPTTDLATLANDLVTNASQERGCAKLFVTRKIALDAVASDQQKVASDSDTLSADVNEVALDNETCMYQWKWSTPREQDKGMGDQLQVELAQAQVNADETQLRQDQKQAEIEERQVEDEALKMVKTLIDRSSRS